MLYWLRTVCSVLFAVLVSLSGNAFAAGPYDGIWTVKFSNFTVGYASIHEKENTLIIAMLGTLDYEWDALMGRRTDNSATLNTVVSDVSATFNLTFTSDTEGSVTLTECSPLTENTACQYPTGTTLSVTRFW